MNESTERAVLLGAACLALLIFLAARLGAVVEVREIIGSLPLLLGSVAVVIILGVVIIKVLRVRGGGSGLFRWSVEGERGELLVLQKNAGTTLVKAFEVLSSPKYQETEQWGQSKTFHPGALEGLTRTGIDATVITNITHPEKRPADGSSDPLLRTFVVVSEFCSDKNRSEVETNLDAKAKALQSALMASTRGCKTMLLCEGELASLAARLLFEETPSWGQDDQGGCSPDMMSSLHLVENKVGDIVEGSILPVARGSDGLNVGRVMFAGSTGEAVRIPLSSISKHVVVFGATGSGKSNTGKLLVKLLSSRGIPVLVLDSHNEYSDVVREAGGNVIELDGSRHLDVLHPFPISDFSDHVSVITDAFNNVFHFTASQYFMFREILTQTLVGARLAEGPNGLGQVVNALDQYYPNSFYENETKFALMRRLKPLVEGEARKAFVKGEAIKMENLISGTCDLMLGDIRDADLRNLFATVVLALLYEYRLTEGVSPLKHVALIEESQNMVPYRDRTQEPSLFEKMFFEMRKYGESLVLVAQFPSQVFPDIVKSAGVKIVHRMTETADSGVAMDLMGLNRRFYSQLKHLPVGRALVLTDQSEEPLTVHIPEFCPSSKSPLADFTISASSVPS